MSFWKWCLLLPCGRQARRQRSPTRLTLHHHRVLVSCQTEYVGVGRRLTTAWKRILRAATVPPRASLSFQVLARRCYSPGGFPGNHHRGGEGDTAGCAEGGQLPTRTPRRPGDSDIIKPNESGGNTKENILTIPNVLTVARMASAPVLGYLVLNKVFMCALGLFVCAGITDILDGYIARNYKNQKSAFGSALDPLADKFLISILMVTMMMVDLIPVPLIVLILSRDVLLIGAAFYVRYMSLPLPRTLKRYFDVRNATATLCPTTISKVNTAVQLSLITLSLAAPIFGYVDHPFLHFFWCMTAATTVASGMSYILARKNVVKILAQQLKK